MATRKATTTTTMRTCIGSKTFGIEAHDAPVADFPVQPSRKDGLGLMCREHWTRYTRSLRQAALARKATGPAFHGVIGSGTLVAHAQAQAVASRARTKAAKPGSPKVARARAIVAAADKLGGTAYIDAVGSDEVQGALETIAKGGAGAEPEPGGNPMLDAYPEGYERLSEEEARAIG